MIPAQFDYSAPSSLEEALSLLSQHTDDAKILAGGHSLIPAMKLRLAQPALLIDIGRLKDLSYVREEGGQIRVGAMTTHYQIESNSRLQEVCPLLPQCAASIGDVQVRNKGTIGGSLAHADPAADWPAAILALDAEIVAASSRGDRVIKAADFFREMMTTALEPDEILREIRIGVPGESVRQAYVKMPHPASGFAIVGIAASLQVDSNGKCERASVGVTGVAAVAYRAQAVEQALAGKALDADAIAEAASHAADNVDPNSDLAASADFRRHLAAVYTRRAITACLAT